MKVVGFWRIGYVAWTSDPTVEQVKDKTWISYPRTPPDGIDDEHTCYLYGRQPGQDGQGLDHVREYVRATIQPIGADWTPDATIIEDTWDTDRCSALQVGPDDFLNAVPIASKDKATKKKKIMETKACRSPVVSGNIPTAHKADMSRTKRRVPIRPKRVFNIRILRIAVANTTPIIPVIISPTLKTTEAIP